MKRTVCMNCGSHRLQEFVDFGQQPNGNNFPAANEADSEPWFPFSMMVCEDCWQVQIAEFPPQEFLFSDHPYVTGLNVPIVRHFGWLADHVIEKLHLDPNSLVIDIGCNDGTLLKNFEAKSMRVLGVDPGERTGQLAKANGVPVAQTFWNQRTGNALDHLNLAPDLITATAVFYHIPDLHDFVSGLKNVMGEKTVFVTQCVYLKDLIGKLQFDHFYHEHSCIHAIAPLMDLFRTHGLRVLDVEFVDVHGGSFLLYVGKEEHPIPTSPSVVQAVEAEKAAGLFDLSTYRTFAARIDKKRQHIRELLDQLRSQGKTVIGLGAPVKGSTLLNYCDIGPDLLPQIAEINPFKIGRVTPGTHIPVIDENDIGTPPDYYLLLSWNFRDFFVDKYAEFLRRGGKIIVPQTEIEIVDRNGTQRWPSA